MIAIATLGDGTAFGALVGLVGIIFGVQQRNGARREQESARQLREKEEIHARQLRERDEAHATRVRELEAAVSELQDEKAELSRRVGNLEASVEALTERNESMRRALRRGAEENNGG